MLKEDIADNLRDNSKGTRIITSISFQELWCSWRPTAAAGGDADPCEADHDGGAAKVVHEMWGMARQRVHESRHWDLNGETCCCCCCRR